MEKNLASRILKWRELKMINKETLLALIKGLTTYDGVSQYDDGIACIKGKNLEILIKFIENSWHCKGGE